MILFRKKDIFKKLKAKALDRKGLGMELAMMVLLVATGCSMLLVTSAMWGRETLTEKEEELVQRLEIDKYAELVLAKGSDGLTDEETALFPGYSNDWDGTSSSFEITYDGKTVLEITLANSKITSWTYKTGE